MERAHGATSVRAHKPPAPLRRNNGKGCGRLRACDTHSNRFKPGNNRKSWLTLRKFVASPVANSKGLNRLLTQNQLIELLESEHVKALMERAEENGGTLASAELEAFALEHDLAEDDAELLPARARGARHRASAPRGRRAGCRRRRSRSTRPAPFRAPPTACSSSSPTSAATSCSPPPRRFRSRSASSAATRWPSGR